MIEKANADRKIQIGAGIVTWMDLSDRFTSYRKSTPIREAITQAATIPGIQGVEISRKNLPENIQEMKALLEELNMDLASLGAGLCSGTQAIHGSISAENAEVRKLSISRIKECMDIAAELGTDKVLIWFAQDGYDYHFETDYGLRWERLVEGMRESARHRKDIRLCIEYKAREPKIHQFINSASTALVLINDIGEDNVGVLFDVGHALLAGETLAESASLLARHKKLWHVHLNDNYFHSDSDLIPGTVHTMAFLELFFWLKRLDYDGYVCFDTVAHSHDPKEITVESVRYTQALMRAADRINNAEMDKIFSLNDATAALSAARQALFNI